MRRSVSTAVSVTTAAALAAAAVAGPASAHGFRHHSFWGPQNRLAPDSVVISGTVFPRHGVDLSVGDSLPYLTGGTSSAPTPPDATAVADGQFPYVFNNDGTDGSFAISTPIDLWDVGFSGQPLGTVRVPTSLR